jgi:DNA polymerase III epsilon subunit-like protein
MLSGVNPFKVKNKTNLQKLQMITDAEIPMMPMFSEEARNLFRDLLERDVSLL